MLTIKEIAGSIADISKEYPVKTAELFGSYAAGNCTEKSDVDILIEFDTPAVSLLMLNSLKYRLEDILNKEVDLVHAPVPPDSLLEIGRRIKIYGA